MNTTITQTDEKTVVTLNGRLDTTNAHDFEIQIQPLFTLSSPRIILECAGLSYISSSGLRVMLVLKKKIFAHNGVLVLRQMRPEIREVFDMTGFSSFFTIE